MITELPRYYFLHGTSVECQFNFFQSQKKMVSSTPPRVLLIGIPLNVEASNELLSWAIDVAARPNDTVVALHILVGKESSKKHDSIRTKKTQFRQAKAFVISVLGEFAHICQSKQVNLEARVSTSTSIGRGLIDEATSISSTFLIVGGLRDRNRSKRNSFGIAKYCFEHAPERCSVVAIGISRPPKQDSDSESLPSEGSSQSSTGWSNNDVRTTKTLSPLQKFFVSASKRQRTLNRSSPTQSISENASPKSVLEVPEEGSQGVEENFSLADTSITEFSAQATKDHGHSNIWKHLSAIRLLLPFFRSSFDASRRGRTESFSNSEIGQPSWRCFSYEEISNATNDFNPDNMVGRGGYAEVYRGDMSDGQTIAVKRLAKDNTEENKRKEFLIELGILGHVSHPNTAHLIGCCFDNGFHLIFEFYPYGNLSSALHSRTSRLLEWPIRYKIIIGIARGLHYLHKCCKRRIIHRDIKASNILLGLDFEPKISDFGLSKWLPKQWTHHSAVPIEGTFGYLAPEYFMQGIVDEKTDVFAFGVLLLEIISGRRPVDSSKQSLIYWAKPLMESGNIEKLADPKLEGSYDVDQIRRLVLIASYCVRQSSLWRPAMNEVLQLLLEGDDSQVAQSWRMPESTVDEIDDYTFEFDSTSTNNIFVDC